MRGSVLIHSADGEVSISELGGDTFVPDSKEPPVLLGGLLNCRAADKSAIFFSTSNRLTAQFAGAGSFSLERFEQIEPDAASWRASGAESGQSRMIYNLRSGSLIIDSRNLSPASQCLIEIPLGRLSLKDAFVGLEIEYDPRGEIYSFVVACSDGQIRFTDHRGQTYTLRTGQRLAGAGTRMTPSVEVGEMTLEWSERKLEFSQAAERYGQATTDLSLYQPQFQMIERAEASEQQVEQSSEASVAERPVVIERAKAPDPVTPFRAEIPPPSAYQADIF